MRAKYFVIGTGVGMAFLSMFLTSKLAAETRLSVTYDMVHFHGEYDGRNPIDAYIVHEECAKPVMLGPIHPYRYIRYMDDYPVYLYRYGRMCTLTRASLLSHAMTYIVTFTCCTILCAVAAFTVAVFILRSIRE